MMFELLLKGYSDKNAATLNLAKWIDSPSTNALIVFLAENNINENLIAEPRILDIVPEATKEFGPRPEDVVLADDGTVLDGKKVFPWWPKEIEVVARKEDNVYMGKIDDENHDGHYVLLNGEPFDPKPSLAVVNHSPDGFCWGYCGSGPAQLALAILLEELGCLDIALGRYQRFKTEYIARIKMDEEFTLTSQDVLPFLISSDEKIHPKHFAAFNDSGSVWGSVFNRGFPNL